ncbi:MAG: ABC transporter ATP-binding protein [Candidatus Humimicrobiaceae bacterium]
MLKVNNLSYSYGKINALSKVSLEIKEGKITALLGSNGSGKSTLVNNIAGLLTPSEGDIFLDGKNITNLPPHKRVESGISVVPERRRLFEHLSVWENLEAGAFMNRKKLESNFDAVCSLFPMLKERRNQIISTLSGGQQQVVALARGMMANPLVLILDEPLLGLQPSIVLEMIKDFKKIADLGTSILLVEQNFFQVSKIMDWAYIMEHTKIVLSGPTEDIINNPEVKKAYLGL